MEKTMGYREILWQEMKTEVVNKPFKNFCHAKEQKNSPDFFEINGGCMGSMEMNQWVTVRHVYMLMGMIQERGRN